MGVQDETEVATDQEANQKAELEARIITETNTKTPVEARVTEVETGDHTGADQEMTRTEAITNQCIKKEITHHTAQGLPVHVIHSQISRKMMTSRIW